VSDLAGNVVAQTVEAPRKLRLLAICALTIAIVATPLVIIRLVNPDDRGVLLFALIVVSSDLLMLATVLLFARTGTVGELDIVWWQRRRSETRWTILLIFASILGGSAAYWGMRYLGFTTESGIELHPDRMSIALILAIPIHSSILTPIAEEVFWRGYVQRTLERVGGGLPAVVGQAILFSAMHLCSFGGSVHAFVVGLILGTWRWRRRTLLPVILAHMIGNTLACIAHWPDWVDVTQVHATIDYISQMNELSKPADYNAVDDAFYDYEKAFRLVVKMPEEIEKSRKRYPADWPQEVREAARKWVDANAQALEHLAQGARKPYYWPVYAGKNATMASLPPLAGARNLASALTARIKLSAYEQNEESLVSDVVTLYEFGNHLRGRKTLVHQLVSVGVHDLAIDAVRDVLAHESLSPPTLDELQSRFESFAEDGNFTMDFSLERLVWLDNVQMTFTHEGNGRGHIPKWAAWDSPNGSDDSSDPRSVVTKEELFKLDRRETIDRIEEFYRHIQIAARQTPWQLRNEPNSIEGALVDLLQKDAFLRTWGFACFRSMKSPWQAHVDLEALIATTGAIRYQRDLGEWPESLEQLVEAGYLEHVPLDCYSNGPLIYKRTADGFLLYSLGADFDDDGGTPSKWGEGRLGGDQVFGPVRDGE
jgi:membrane protease YdiL (CAAX protease family)